MKPKEYRLYRGTGRVNGKIVYRIHIVATDISVADALAQAWVQATQINVKWRITLAQSLTPSRVIIGPA